MDKCKKCGGTSFVTTCHTRVYLKLENGVLTAVEEEDTKETLHSMVGNKDDSLIKPVHVKVKFRYIINHDKKEFIDKSEIRKDESGMKIHPLSLFTCEGNGRGGGDFHGEDDRIGSWSRDRISMENSLDNYPDYKEVDGQFFED
jgi:hypothetical protein